MYKNFKQKPILKEEKFTIYLFKYKGENLLYKIEDLLFNL
jgi:hypothetical protein